jgi:hypothetical protein
VLVALALIMLLAEQLEQMVLTLRLILLTSTVGGGGGASVAEIKM